ncbi:MAG: tetratricopeptide repeat protein [Candidatus Heimdallarchaeota archaeon]|nr:tetratricopeptide repeat protein [Candidatus Heimdallarchaeota archaeon]
MDKGNYGEVQIRLEQLKSQDIDETMDIKINLLLAKIKREKGNAKQSIEISLDSIHRSKLIPNDILTIKAIQETAYAHWYLGNYDQGIKLCEDSNDLMKSQPAELIVNLRAQNLLLLGNLYGDKNRPEDSLRYYTDSLKLYQEIGNILHAGHVLNNIGEVYRYQGKLDESLVCYSRSKEYFEKVDNQIDVAMVLSNIAEVNREKGELKLALDYALQALKVQTQMQDGLFSAFTNITIGLIHHSQGNINEAIKYYETSVDTLTKQDNILWTSQAVYYYILALTEVDIEESQKQFQLMQSIVDKNQEEIKLIELQHKVLQAVLLKKSNKLANLVSAQELFTEIVKSKDVIDFSITLLAMKHLAELLLVELKLFNNPDTLTELIDLIAELGNIAELHGSILLKIQIYILFAKLKAIDGDFQITNETLDLAYNLAKQKELPKYMKEVEKTREEIFDEIKKYSDSDLKFKEIQNRLTHIDVEAYLNEILINGILSGKKQN